MGKIQRKATPQDLQDEWLRRKNEPCEDCGEAMLEYAEDGDICFLQCPKCKAIYNIRFKDIDFSSPN